MPWLLPLHEREPRHMATPNVEGGWERESTCVPSKKMKCLLVNPNRLCPSGQTKKFGAQKGEGSNLRPATSWPEDSEMVAGFRHIKGEH